LPEFVDTEIKHIDDRLRELKDEASRLEAARAALTGGTRPRGRLASNGAVRPLARSDSRRNGRPVNPRARRTGNTRANQALELVRKQPGITIPDMAQAMKIQPNYLYRVLPRLASDGEIKRDGQGWHPASSSASTSATPARAASPRRRPRVAKSEPKVSTGRTATSRRRAGARSVSTNRTARGATRASVLAALAGGEAMTAGQVAAETGLARATASTTLSNLAKSGGVQKAARGYRLEPTATVK